MKWIIASLLIGASLASALPRNGSNAFCNKFEPIFYWIFFAELLPSLFSVVQFPNDECTTNMNNMAGQCVTAEECGNNGGTAAGNCASGFGVCCSYV